MADYPTEKRSTGKANNGLTGKVVDSSIEGRVPETDTIRAGTKGKKGAGNVGSSNVNHS